MKARLLHKQDSPDWRVIFEAAAAREAEHAGRHYGNRGPDDPTGMPWNLSALTSDLALDALLGVMARDDRFVYEVARRTILTGIRGDVETILYRQEVLRDCMSQPSVVRELYAITEEALQAVRKDYLGSLERYPEYVLRHSITLMTDFLCLMRKLRAITDAHAENFTSTGWSDLCAMLKRDMNDEYLAEASEHVERLKMSDGKVLLSAGLGVANTAERFLLHETSRRKRTLKEWLEAVFTIDPGNHANGRHGSRPPVLSFTLDPRDEAGFRALGEIRGQGISAAATALALSADHVGSFFRQLRVELAFYIGCLNLRERLVERGMATCVPTPASLEGRHLSARGLYDVGLALTVDGDVVGNDVSADGRSLVVITGANTGGKSTFLRSVGLAQLMMQCGMFVPAEEFSSSVCHGLFTHYKREEDPTMERGKFDEELARMNDIVDHIRPGSMMLFNEPFATTNEREGSEVARQVITALLDQDIRVLCVTHLYELGLRFWEIGQNRTLFLRANRDDDGSRTFKLVEGKPLPTAFGDDLYKAVFDAQPNANTSS